MMSTLHNIHSFEQQLDVHWSSSVVWVLKHAFTERLRRPAPKHPHHWLDYSKLNFDSKLILDMKVVFAILLLFVPLPIFWSLFDQQGSRWTFQVLPHKPRNSTH